MDNRNEDENQLIINEYIYSKDSKNQPQDANSSFPWKKILIISSILLVIIISLFFIIFILTKDFKKDKKDEPKDKFEIGKILC